MVGVLKADHIKLHEKNKEDKGKEDSKESKESKENKKDKQEEITLKTTPHA